MRIFNSLQEIERDKNTVVTLGTFDGLHLGHQRIIDTVVKKAFGYNARNFLVTFDPHPRKILSKENNIKLLSTLDEKLALLTTCGIENILVINFTRDFSQLTPEQFLTKYLVEGTGVKEVVIGYDHHFGKGRGGGIDLLTDFGLKNNFDVTVVSEFVLDDETVSSTKVRHALIDGDLVKANKMLGRLYSFNGKVIRGDGRGRELGFPTANLQIENEDKLLPAIGIYAAECIIDRNKFYGLLSIGSRPTFYSTGEIIPEFYIFDFNKDIYDKAVRINVVERIRGEEKFNSAEELINQMKKDKEVGLEILSKLTN
jgi:riboflavin kinase/FMN adenylyltransferase